MPSEPKTVPEVLRAAAEDSTMSLEWMNYEDLAPCPFCVPPDDPYAALAQVAKEVDDGETAHARGVCETTYFVECGCGARGPRCTEANDAAKSWNAVFASPALRAAADAEEARAQGSVSRGGRTDE